MGRRQMTASRGFTLIEVLAALAIASIGLLGLLRLHLASLATAQTAATVTEATFLAQEKNAETCAGGFPQLGSHSGTTERNGVHFEWTTEVTDCRSLAIVTNPQSSIINHQSAVPAISGLRGICTTVSWPQGSGGRSVQMTTYAVESHFSE